MNKTNTSSVGTTTASTNISVNLQIGSKGSAVKDLQEKLIKMGYDCGGYGADGEFGTGTYNSVVKFQKDHQLVQDGIVGSQTNQAIANALKTSNNGVPNYIMGKINASSTGSSTLSAGTNYSTILQRGSKGNSVVELQKKLITMGYDCGRFGADGVFGQDTYNAVKRFQSDYGLVQSGSIDSQTSQAISNALKIGNNGVPIYIMHKSNASSTASSTNNVGTGYSQNNLSISMVNIYNSEVEKLQRDLTSMGYTTNGVDGYFGKNTEVAVRKFQQDHKLVEDGVAGVKTKNAILNATATTRSVQGPSVEIITNPQVGGNSEKIKVELLIYAPIGTSFKDAVKTVYGHSEISIGDKIYTYGRYDPESTNGPAGIYGDGVLIVADREKLLADSRKEREIYGFTLNLSNEEATKIEKSYTDLIKSQGYVWKDDVEWKIKYKFNDDSQYQ